MTNQLQWWADAVRGLADDTLEQVASGIGSVPVRKIAPVTEGDRLLNNMHDMAVAELGRRSKAEIAQGH